jgi:hypothetical protein
VLPFRHTIAAGHLLMRRHCMLAISRKTRVAMCIIASWRRRRSNEMSGEV